MRKSSKKKDNIHSDYIIPRNQHHVSKTEINPNALTVLNRLNTTGFDSYLVGGSVRDLLLRKSPKDFDVATSATPNQIRKHFKNARIIGRRFKLVHILYHREIIEVATFRGHEKNQKKIFSSKDEHLRNERGMLVRDNVYGNLEEDAFRRDFTINSLYYDIKDSSIIDYTGGFQDIQNQLIRIIGDPDTRFQEDPVRILRAIRFSAKLDFNIEPKTADAIKRGAHLLHHVSNARLFDEMIKLYHCGHAKSVQEKLNHFGVFEYLFPQTHTLIGSSKFPIEKLMTYAFESTDSRLQSGKPVTPSFLFAVLLWFPFLHQKTIFEKHEDEALNALEKSMSYILREQCKYISIPKRHTQVIREMWLFQYRLQKRNSKRAQDLLEHPRFRAAYDFLGLRALAGDESMELAEWWTTFQDATLKEQKQMLAIQKRKTPPNKRYKKKKKT